VRAPKGQGHPQFFETGLDGQRWFSDFERGLNEANIINGLGDFIGLKQWGDKLDEALRIIRDKFEAGCPILLQGCSSLVSSQPDQPQERRIRELLGPYGVHLTPVKVASRVQEVTTNSSPFCCVFRSEDDTLLDPSLFEGVPSAVSYGNRLISYDPGVFPLIGMPAMTSTRSRRKFPVITDQTQSAVTPDYLPGWENNTQFADNLIDGLTAHVGERRPSASATLYDLFRELETLLGKLIQTVLGSNSPIGDFRDLIPESVQKKLNGLDGFDYSRATYIDLVVILRDHIGKFDSYFAQPAKDILRLLFEINSGPRVNLVHPHRAAQLGVKFAGDDVEILTRALDLVREAYLAASSSRNTP